MGEVRIQGIPRIGAGRIHLHRRLEPAGVIQARRSHNHEVGERVRFHPEGRPTRRTEAVGDGVAQVARDDIIRRLAGREGEGRGGNPHIGGERPTRRALAIPTVTARHNERFRRTFIANRATGAATCKWSRDSHKKNPPFSSRPYQFAVGKRRRSCTVVT